MGDLKGAWRTLNAVAISSDGKRIESSESPLWRKHVTFSEYFDGDTGEGLGATHQTGWTALVAKLIGYKFKSETNAGVTQTEVYTLTSP